MKTFRSTRYTNWVGSMFMRFGASCCPTWDPSNWASRRLPTLMSFWIKSRPAENEKLLRTSSEEEIFKKRPKRKGRRRRKSADDTADNFEISAVAQESAVVLNGATVATSGGEEGKQNTVSESSSFSSESQAKCNKGRSRKEQAELRAKSGRGGGRGGYTAANLRRFAAEKKDKNLDKRSVSLNTIKNNSGNTSTHSGNSNSGNSTPVTTGNNGNHKPAVSIKGTF